MATRTHSDRIWKARFAVWSYTQFAEEQLPTTTTVKDVLRLPRTSADYCRLFCQVNHNEQALLTWIVNRRPVGRVKLLQEQQLSLEDKLHYHANNNERAHGLFHHNLAPLSFQVLVLPGLGTRQCSASPNVLPASSHPFWECSAITLFF